ncbi:segregation/condensation protein A [bacterium]|nr:segregation/condensation protein A [bacterium]
MSTLYKIKLQNFEGPLDLLLFFVRKDELNIYDIPLARITKSYLEYLQLMHDLNLDIASEFILMAATLMRIKVRTMLPKDPVPEDEEDMMDPREELSRRLIEYRQFKEASKSLSELDEYWRQVYRRSYFNFDLLPQNEEEVIGLKDISFFDLLAAYKKALEKKPIAVFHSIERLNVTVEDQQKYIMDFFRDRSCYLFTELCDDMAKVEIVVTFLALLDLVKRADIAIKQASIFDDIWIYKASEFKEDVIPTAERVETDLHELTESIIGENVSHVTAETESTAEAVPIVDDASQDDVSPETLTTPTEIKAEFAENGIRASDVQDNHDPSDTEYAAALMETELTKSTTDATERLNDRQVPVIEKSNKEGQEFGRNSYDDETTTNAAVEEKKSLAELNRDDEDHRIVSDLEKEETNTDNVDETRPEDESSNAVIDVIETKFDDAHADEQAGAEELLSQRIVSEENIVTEESNVERTEVAGSHTVEQKIFDTKFSEDDHLAVRDEKAVPEIAESAAGRVSLVEEPEAVEKEKEPEKKVTRWKSFFHIIVSIVRKIFSK